MDPGAEGFPLGQAQFAIPVAIQHGIRDWAPRFRELGGVHETIAVYIQLTKYFVTFPGLRATGTNGENCVVPEDRRSLGLLSHAPDPPEFLTRFSGVAGQLARGRGNDLRNTA